MVIRRMAVLAVATVGLFALTGCGGEAKRALGLERKVPDEFMVVRNAPLTLPPDYGLRPPSSTEQERASDQASREGAAILFGQNRTVLGDTFGRGELSLLVKAGATDVDPNIRRILREENASWVTKPDGFVDSLLFWQEQRGTPDAVLDATAESQRLRENSQQGLPPTEGDSPMIRRAGE